MSAMPVASRPYSHHNVEELLELHPHDYCSLTSTSIPICQGPPSFMPNSKETDLTGELLNNNRNLTFTEFLSDNSDHLLEYDCYPNSCAQATTCSSPDSECTTFAEKHENFDYWPSFYTMTSPTADLSVNPANITATAAAPNAPITPIASPHDQSPVMQSSDLPSPLMHAEREVPDVLRTGIMQQPEDYQQMVNIPATPPKTPGKSRGRRMSNKPTKPGTKCFECTYSECGRVFKRSEHLKRHVRSIHTLERPFHCPYPHCAKRFSRSDNLSQHIRVHRPNGKDKAPQARPFSNFTPYMESYPNTTTIPQ